MSILSVWKAHPEAIIHIPWITCLGYNAIELSRVCLMRSFWKLVLRFKCCRSKSTQMVSSLLYFNLWRCLVRACTNATAKTKRVTFWHAPCSEALEFSFISSGSERKWFIHLTSWLRTLAYEKFSRGLFLACRLQFFFFILSFVVSLVISFLTSSFQWNCNCMCVSVNIPRHRFRLAGYRNSKNLAFEALLEMISVSGSISITEKYFAFEWHEYIETDKHDAFIIVTFAAWSTLSLPFAVSKTKRKKKHFFQNRP